ncbi:MAG TPA: oxidoreductase [Microthrixaceae bacterium]|nr:oxidoreductase [Microthrixaceae bacterium]
MRTSKTWTSQDIPDQHGRIAVVTGANSGLGLESAKALARSGAMVVMACRNLERGEAARLLVEREATGEAPRLQELDLADLSSVSNASAELAKTLPHIDILLNNAGVMALPERWTAEGHEMQFGTNHLGHFALTAHLLPLLDSANNSRVVTTSSHMHRIGKMHWEDLDWKKGYRRWPAYGQSKLANLLFAMELDRRASAAGSTVESMAAHPGYASTGLQQAGPNMSDRKLAARVVGLGNMTIAQSAQMGALPQLFAATSPTAMSGRYYGPGGVGELHGSPREVKPMSAALSREEGHRLWNISENLTGVRFEWPDRVGS